jgi:serine/threonine-protein kinase
MRTRVEEIFHAVADLSEEARAGYFAERNVDATTRREVEGLMAFDSPTMASLDRDIGQAAQEALAQVNPKGLRCGPYRLGDLVGWGGMGTVYSAERVDGEVAQLVAVKLLRPGADDPQLRQRFLGERQILAALSHPNIAKLLDAGHREDGQPYLVMEYVEGRPIDVYTTGLGLRQKLKVFLKVCAAVSYLHRNLVVHRDLKPSNILVSSEGEPMLLDFGIAKMLGLNGDSTVTAARMLTPDYASPEQVTGGAITTASDIYSLGAMLYKLLTGVCPHQFEGHSTAAIALAISSGRIAPPSKLVPGLKSDLEIVLMKALRNEPQERYASVEHFSEDLENYLQSHPIRARKGDAWYRTRKFLRRYWLPVAAATFAFGGLSAGLALAKHQRAIAERRFEQLHQLSNKVLDLDGAIRYLPGSINARRRLVSASLDYLEGLSGEAHGNLELAQEISDGYIRLARIQGVSLEFNLGDSAKAEESLKKAEALNESVRALDPHDRMVLYRAATIAHDRMAIAKSEERRADILVHARRAVEELEAFLRHDPRAAEVSQSQRRSAANIYVNIGLTYVNLLRYTEGARCARRAVELAQSIPSAQDVATEGLSVLANALRYQGDLAASLTTIRQAQELSQQANYPTEAARLFKLYSPLVREGLILGEKDAVNLDRPAEAIEAFKKALDIAEEVARKDANDSASRIRVGTAARYLGELLCARNPRQALEVYDLGIRRLAETRNNVEALRYRAVLLAKSSYSLRRLHRAAEAKARIDAAFAILQGTKDYPAERIRIDGHAYVLACALADHQAETGEPREALETYEELLRKVLAGPPAPNTSLPEAVSLSRLYTSIGSLDRRAGRNDAASTFESKSLELWRYWDAKLPNNSFVRRQLNGAARSCRSVLAG